MTRSDFVVSFHKLLSQRAGTWLPEEATEELFFDILRQRIDEHDDVIRKELIFNNRKPLDRTNAGSWP